MRKAIYTFILTSLVLAGFGQKNTPPSSAMNQANTDDLMSQAKHKRVTGIIMVSVGSGMVMGGLLMVLAGTFNGSFDTNHTNNTLVTAGAITSVAGLGLALGSIPMFIKSHRLKKEARLSFQPQILPVPLPRNQVARIRQSQLSFSIPIGR